MMLIAILLPWLSFFLRGKILTGIICALLQATLIGWLPAAIWAALSLSDKREERRTKKLIRAINRNS
jgi:uncharacterized membrane protein YqaE (UPF0057 family)